LGIFGTASQTYKQEHDNHRCWQNVGVQWPSQVKAFLKREKTSRIFLPHPCGFPAK
jgi:hypothetical protein